MPAALSRRAFAGLVACACLPAAAALAQSPAPSPTGRYICPPCGCSNDEKVFDKPGVCPDPACAMTLIAAPEPAQPAPPQPTAPTPR